MSRYDHSHNPYCRGCGAPISQYARKCAYCDVPYLQSQGHQAQVLPSRVKQLTDDDAERIWRKALVKYKDASDEDNERVWRKALVKYQQGGL